MTAGGVSVVAFVVFGLMSQAILVCFFAARRWAPPLAQRYGWLAYAFAALGLPFGIWLILNGESWRLYAGPMLMASWAVLGATVDLWRPIEWRDPVRWGVLAPYVALYFWAQMFLWWPLWDIQRAAWAVFLVLFVANTAMNLRGHFEEDSTA